MREGRLDVRVDRDEVNLAAAAGLALVCGVDDLLENGREHLAGAAPAASGRVILMSGARRGAEAGGGKGPLTRRRSLRERAW